MTKEIKSINVLSFAKHMAIYLGLLNLLAAVYSAIIFPYIVNEGYRTFSQIMLALGNNLILGLVTGFLVFGIFGGLLYNLFAAIFGGIKINLE